MQFYDILLDLILEMFINENILFMNHEVLEFVNPFFLRVCYKCIKIIYFLIVFIFTVRPGKTRTCPRKG